MRNKFYYLELEDSYYLTVYLDTPVILLSKDKINKLYDRILRFDYRDTPKLRVFKPGAIVPESVMNKFNIMCGIIW